MNEPIRYSFAVLTETSEETSHRAPLPLCYTQKRNSFEVKNVMTYKMICRLNLSLWPVAHTNPL